jgi:glycosyltransferase involved in cell wall biosynthesis
MQKVRYFAVRGSAHSCEYCETLGFTAPTLGDQGSPEFAQWLESAGYSHIVFGCGVQPGELLERYPNFAQSELVPVFVRHHARDLDPLTNSWLVSDHVPRAGTPGMHPPFIWIPRKGPADLASQVRAFPREWREHFFVHWPHPKLLTRQQEYLAQSFPYLSWRLPRGWDLFNPEIDADLELEARPDFTRDVRTKDFKPEVSIIIPTYNNQIPLRSTVIQALKSKGSFEVLVADDGSDDGTREWFDQTYRRDWPEELVYINMRRPRRRFMGKGGFRAGIARNTASVLARGRILLFLDSDILVPNTYVNELVDLHSEFDLIQGTRLQLKNTAPTDHFQDYEKFAPIDFEPANEMWETFQRRLRPWDDLNFKWKFVSTFCLSIKRDAFFKLGAFRRSFHKYGFEDTDLGYRAAQAGMKFHRSKTAVYHFKHFEERSEYRHSPKLKQELLKESARIFFLNNPELEVLHALPAYLRDTGRWGGLWT